MSQYACRGFCDSRYMKRTFDLVIATAIVLAVLPLVTIIAVVVKMGDWGPVFYKARRVGRSGEIFSLYKFRTMTVEADRHGPGITIAGDSRITPIGRILRRSKLDELPQLLNVLRGEMSLVGPRPEDPRYVRHYTDKQREVLSVRPGITGAASVEYRDEERILVGPDWETQYMHVIMPHKLEIELDYLKRRSLVTDLILLGRTALSLVR